jgi:uncharacterized membrane protein YbhN (UPF0104 family)
VAVAASKALEAPEDAQAPPQLESARRTPLALRAAGLGLLAVAASWAVHDLNWDALRGALGTIDPFFVLLATTVNMVAVYVMAGRWLALLRPLAPFLTHMEAFRAMVMGFAVSTIVPARAGELARAEWLGRKTGLPRAAIFGSIVLDSLVNAVGMFAGIALLPLLVELPVWLQSGIWLAVAIFAAFALVVFLLRPEPGQPTLRAAGAPVRGVGSAVAGFLARSRLGLAAMQDRLALSRSLAASLLAWLLEINVVLFTLKAFHLDVSFGVSLLVLMAVNLALAVPFAPPANLGSLEAGAMLALMDTGVPKEQALAFALTYHLLQVIPIGFAGLALASRSLLQPAPAPGTSPSG